MKLLWAENAWEDYLYWQGGDRDVLRRINALLQDIRRNPFAGIIVQLPLVLLAMPVAIGLTVRATPAPPAAAPGN